MPPLLHPAKILLVDDKPENILALEAVLGGPEYHLLRAHSGREALRIVEETPDLALVLLDVQMPIMDGFEVARRIKALPQARDLPIIFITAIFTEDPFVKQGFQAGGVDYFSKPFDPEILKLKVAIYSAFRQKENLLRERERQVKESEELLQAGRRLSAILESLPVGVIIADAQGRISQANDEVLRLLKLDGQDRTDSYGAFLTWWNRDGFHLKEPGGPLARAITRGDASHSEVIKIKCFDGVSRLIYVSASPLRSFAGDNVGAVVLLQDASQHKAVERDFELRVHHLVSRGLGLEGAGRS